MSPSPLVYYDQFKQVLDDYHLSPRALKTLKTLHFAPLLGPTSVGRNTLINHLVKTGSYYYIISDTTRKPEIRDGQLEQDGVQYFFRSEPEILADLKAGEFLEAEIIHNQQVSGISIRELERAAKTNKTAVTDIELGGITNILAIKPDAVAIMLLPPSFEEWQNRINSRGTMPEDDYMRRMHTALRIFESGLEQDHYNFVIAEDVDESVNIINSVVNGGPSPHQERAKILLKTLCQETKKVIH